VVAGTKSGARSLKEFFLKTTDKQRRSSGDPAPPRNSAFQYTENMCHHIRYYDRSQKNLRDTTFQILTIKYNFSVAELSQSNGLGAFHIQDTKCGAWHQPDPRIGGSLMSASYGENNPRGIHGHGYEAITAYFAQRSCRMCSQPYQADGIQLVREEPGVIVVKVDCTSCGQPLGIALVAVQPARETQQPPTCMHGRPGRWSETSGGMDQARCRPLRR
jgi:hypothetical protein